MTGANNEVERMWRNTVVYLKPKSNWLPIWGSNCHSTQKWWSVHSCNMLFEEC